MPPTEGAAPASAPNPELEAVAAKIEGGGADATAAAGDAGLGAELPRVASAVSRDQADALARMGLDWILDGASRQYPVLSYPEATRARGARLGGAVLVKYDVLAWAGRWRAEFEFGAFVAGLAWESYRLVQRARVSQPVTDQAPAAAGTSPPAAS